MTSAPQTDSIHAVDRLISRLYRSGTMVAPEQFRAWALDQVREVIPHDAALWGSGSRARWKFHAVTVTHLPAEFPRVLEATTRINPILPRILQNLDTPVDMASVLSDDEFFRSEIYQKVFGPHGISRILSTAHLDQRSGLYSLVTLYRRDRAQRFSEEEKALQKRVTYHLFNAASSAYFFHLMKSMSDRPPGSAAAVVGSDGVYHEAQPRFLDLLDERFPARGGTALPIPLPEPGQSLPFQDLMVRCDPLAELKLITIWPAGPLDRLTQREREIVNCVAQGLSFKQAAKKIGVAPSTVANHLYRVYRKLGVYSRTELAQLVYPPD